MIPYLLALVLGLACTVLIAPVVVNFDEETTQAWLLASVLAAGDDAVILRSPFHFRSLFNDKRGEGIRRGYQKNNAFADG